MIKSNYEVEVLVNGHPVKEYQTNPNKTYIEAKNGNKFSIRIKNNGYRKILAVPTVDGLSVIDGKEASFDSRGYILNGYSTITIDGWRTSNQEVAEFFFTNPEGSYSKKMKRKDNLGVIGVAVFCEKEKERNIYTFSSATMDWNGPNDMMPQSMPIAMYSCSVRSVSQDVGTGFGSAKKSVVTEAEFDRESNPDAVFEIFYNTRKQLEKLGVDFKPVQYITPQAFPNGFCQRPE